jgi:uncharacterized protein YdhG (YjbR/CyaY superfamily)
MKKAASVEEYLAGVPEPARSTLTKLRATIRAAAPASAVEKISYGMPAFYYKGTGLAAYAAFKAHCSYFPMDGGLTAELADELKDYATEKGTIRFSREKPLPATLVRKLVKAKAAKIDAKK